MRSLNSNTFCNFAIITAILLTFIIDAAVVAAPQPSGNLVVNGGFEMVTPDDKPEGWVLKASHLEKECYGRVVNGGHFGKKRLELGSQSEAAFFSAYTQPVEVSSYAGHEMLFTMFYRAEQAIRADAVITTYAEDFTQREFATPPLTREAIQLDANKRWDMVSRHLSIPVNARHMVIALHISGNGKVFVDGVNMRSLPAEIGCEVLAPGLVVDPANRVTQLRIANNTSGLISGKIRMEMWQDNKKRGDRDTNIELNVGDTVPIDIPYRYDFGQPHELHISVTDQREEEIYEYRVIQVPSLIDARIIVPAFRSTLIADVPTEYVTVEGRIHAVPKLISSTVVSARIAGGAETGPEADTKVTLEPNGSFHVKLKPANIVSGKYYVALTATVDSSSFSTAIPLFKSPPNPGQIAYDEYGQLWVQGKPKFPIGMGYVLDAIDLKDITTAGHDFVIVPAMMASWDFMDAADKLGQGVFLSSASLEEEFWRNMLNKHGVRRSFWGWYTLEKPEEQLPAVSPKILSDVRNELAALTPGRPVLSALSTVQAIHQYQESGDVVLAWNQPMPPSDMASIARLIQGAVAETDPRKPVWAIIPIAGQAHIRGDQIDINGVGRPPTPQEYRAMVYTALISGARGIVNYAYKIPGAATRADWLITRDAPALWEQVKFVNNELKTIGTTILRGRRQSLPPDPDAAVHYGAWEVDGNVIVIMVNTSGNPSIAYMQVDNIEAKRLNSMNDPSSLLADETGHFARSLQPFEVALYAGKLAAQTPQQQ